VGRIGDGTGAVFVPAVTLADALVSCATAKRQHLTDRPYLATGLARGDCWFGTRRMVSMSASVRY
jgi:iron complex outermembrane recepter protein